LTRRRIVYGGLLGAPLLALFAGGLVAAGQGAASAATTVSAVANTTDKEQFVAAVLARFAARLGRDEAAVNAAFVGALAEAADQAAREGKVTPAEATEFKEETAKLGLKGVLLNSARPDGVEKSGPTNEVVQAMFEAGAAAFGVTPEQLKREGKSIADLAKERGIDLQRVRESMVAVGKTKLAEAVQRGAIGQEQARGLEADLPDIALKLTSAGRDVSEVGRPVEQAIWEVAAKSLGLEPAQMKQGMAAGKSIADLAQEKGVAVQQVKEAMLAAGEAQLTALVQQGKLTQAQADERRRGLAADIDKMIALKPGVAKP
jgi:hypothetical protein